MLKAKSPYDCEIDDVVAVTKDGSHQLNLTVLRDNEFVCNKQVFVSKQEYKKILEENRIEWYHLYPERARSNNSMVIVRSQITKDMFHEKWEVLKDSGSGEPGFYFTNDREMGTNHCCEIGLNPFLFLMIRVFVREVAGRQSKRFIQTQRLTMKQTQKKRTLRHALTCSTPTFFVFRV